jgi:plastocyanin
MANAWLTLEPGTYAMVCYIPAADGQLHLTHGMMRELTVTKGTAATASAPKPDVEMKLTDYAFDLSKPIQAGTRTIRIVNTATQSHEVVFGKLAPGKTLKQALQWLDGGQHGPAPVIAMGGASGLAQGKSQTVRLTFEPGTYVLLCFIPDVKDDQPHSAHGMAREITVAP